MFLEYNLLLYFSLDIWLHLGKHGTWKDEIKWKQCQSKTRSQKYSRTEKESHAGNYLLSNNFGSVFHIHNCLCKLFSFESLNYDPLLSILPIYFLRWRLFVLIIDVIQSHFNLSCKFLASDVQNRWSQRLNFENHIWRIQNSICWIGLTQFKSSQMWSLCEDFCRIWLPKGTQWKYHKSINCNFHKRFLWNSR